MSDTLEIKKSMAKEFGSTVKAVENSEKKCEEIFNGILSGKYPNPKKVLNEIHKQRVSPKLKLYMAYHLGRQVGR